jgi:hypothetical protein
MVDHVLEERPEQFKRPLVAIEDATRVESEEEEEEEVVKNDIIISDDVDKSHLILSETDGSTEHEN